MSEDYLPYGRQWLTEGDIDAVVNVLRSDWLTTGPNVDEFEAGLCEVGGAKHAVAVNSGTAALHTAYEAAGVGPGDEVIVPAQTFSATANAALYLGATVRFADIDPATMTMDPASAEALVNEKTRVIAPVDFTGHPADYDALRAISDDCGAILVADAAHSIGATYKGRPVGSIADLTCFSFHPVKTITTGEGGAVLTDDDEIAERMREFRCHGMVRGADSLPGGHELGSWGYDIRKLGFNYRITDFQCALGKSQLARLDDWLERRRFIADQYRKLLADHDQIELPADSDWCEQSYHLFVVRIPAEERHRVFEALRERGIGVQVHYIPVNMLSAYQELGYRPEDTPICFETYETMFSMPCFPAMSDDDIERSASALLEMLG